MAPARTPNPSRTTYWSHCRVKLALKQNRGGINSLVEEVLYTSGIICLTFVLLQFYFKVGICCPVLQQMAVSRSRAKAISIFGSEGWTEKKDRKKGFFPLFVWLPLVDRRDGKNMWWDTRIPGMSHFFSSLLSVFSGTPFIMLMSCTSTKREREREIFF